MLEYTSFFYTFFCVFSFISHLFFILHMKDAEGSPHFCHIQEKREVENSGIMLLKNNGGITNGKRKTGKRPA